MILTNSRGRDHSHGKRSQEHNDDTPLKDQSFLQHVSVAFWTSSAWITEFLSLEMIILAVFEFVVNVQHEKSQEPQEKIKTFILYGRKEGKSGVRGK